MYKIKAEYCTMFYPKGKQPQESTYKIVKVLVTEVIEQEENKLSVGDTISIKGYMPFLSSKDNYLIHLELEGEHPQYGNQWKVTFVNSFFTVSNDMDAKKFLTQILSEKQAESILSLSNPLEVLENQDIESLSKLNGIKEKTAQNIINKYNKNKNFIKIYKELGDYELSDSTIEKLIDKYKSPEGVIEAIKKDVYILSELDGFGFNKADKHFIKQGGHINSPKRISAYILYYLKNQSLSGNSWVKPNVFAKEIYDTFGNELDKSIFGSVIKDLENTNKIIYDREKQRIGLKAIYYLELQIANEIKRLMAGELLPYPNDYKDRIKNLEDTNGWEYSPSQKEGIETLLLSPVSVVTGLAGCVDCDTEYFNGIEWKRIADYVEGDKVFQFGETCSLIVPELYHRHKCHEFIKMKFSSTQTYQIISDDHNILYFTSEDNYNDLRKGTLSQIKLEYKLGNDIVILNEFDENSKQITYHPFESISFEPYTSKDGYKYCFTVPSGMLVLRRDENIFITGNCGKSTIIKAVNTIYGEEINNIQCALSGCASQRIAQVSGEVASTIHKTLDYNPVQGWGYNKENKLPRGHVILDEASMVSGDLFIRLLQAIPTGSKLTIVGDYGQLESIGLCNVFFDLLKAEVPVIKLTEIHRQAQQSEIIMASYNVRHQKQLFDSNFRGNKVLGELQDLELCIEDKTKLQELIINKFLLQSALKGVENVQGIVPMKERGQISCYELNTAIQNRLKLDRTAWKTKTITDDKCYKFHIGDKVINTKNDYKTKTPNDVPCPIFNGNIGIVKSIGDSYMIVDFFTVGEILLPEKNIQKLELAYFITVHKMQGMESDTVIVGLDMSSYTMLTNELLYTSLSRASKYCILAAENKSVRMCISTLSTTKKQTWLADLLNS